MHNAAGKQVITNKNSPGETGYAEGPPPFPFYLLGVRGAQTEEIGGVGRRGGRPRHPGTMRRRSSLHIRFGNPIPAE